ncbi:bifunctional diaminohydroxyphosphoribosylaminopyrimidine deaminase/5-amino-6-(5-phosphoribosylamino)uracil reductase RibD [Sphingomonas sp. Y38-1Y]|uniref:bifunctional diaminohydroxyphosphoribosylaminopyrimidine deaminase/5-amino-6-(5-phosphoribosylamino)uracil reductase RibD n=1 Tax=Sphingomonas sp. Y38-1Y TaxID=3078265 RepID=UPI0028E2465A|nr:bifunctional diaminohydroxyphosphoribosylaminopyrimidine deaminase/5-amino-6-(5-phosphoribosylamino)uracil reductase RibD [Sphingomonas sp. Y38-1Y]
MGAALALATRGRGRTSPNPSVGCVIVRKGRVVGRGWTQPTGRPHAEAMALAEAGEAARGATAYVTLEPCAHTSPRGPACADLLVASGIARVVAALRDPDPRTDGQGLARLSDAGIAVVSGVREAEARDRIAGFLTCQRLGRPHVTLKLALSLDGGVSMADGRSQWITGPEARAHAHLERSRHELILVGAGTLTADTPSLDVRLPGLQAQSPTRVLLSRRADTPPGWLTIREPADIAGLPGDHLMVEGGAATAAAFLKADLVDRLLLYRAPILIGAARTLGDIGLSALGDAHGRWRQQDRRTLGVDTLEVYGRA